MSARQAAGGERDQGLGCQGPCEGSVLSEAG